MELTEAQKRQIEEVREWLLHLLTESLRAAEMRQGCTNHSSYAEIIAGQILSKLTILDKDQSIPPLRLKGINLAPKYMSHTNFRRIIPMGEEIIYPVMPIPPHLKTAPPMEGTDANR